MTDANSSIQNKKVLSFREAMAITGLSKRTLQRQRDAGLLKVTKLSARRVGIRSDHLAAWLDSRVS